MIKLSIITINFNNKIGLQETFDSVFKQSFSDYEYIVIDGESTDGSKEIIEANKDKISHWVSEKDGGVYHAMNKAIAKASGEYLLFLNSGDHLINNTILNEVSAALDGTDIIYGNIFLIESVTKSWTGNYPARLSFQHFVEGSLPHPASFIRRTVFDTVGLYDESLQICADWKFFLDAICRFNVSYKHLDKTIAVFYLDGLSSTAGSAQIINTEKQSVFQKEYPLFIEMYQQLNQLNTFRNNKLINRFASIANTLGVIKFDFKK